MTSSRRLRARARYRLAQARAFIRPGAPPALPPNLEAALRPGTIPGFRQLAAADQWHLLAVHQALVAAGASDDLAIAGLLHDIGKVHEGHQVRFTDRCLKVALNRIAPARLARFAQAEAPRRQRGLWIACNHARIGADLVRELGYAERVCWLIAHHEEPVPRDPDLRQLQQADDARATVVRTSDSGPMSGKEDPA